MARRSGRPCSEGLRERAGAGGRRYGHEATPVFRVSMSYIYKP